MPPQLIQVAIVDDEADMRDSISQWLGLSGFDVAAYASAEAALPHITSRYAGVIISDIRMPGIDGISFLKRLMAIDSNLPVIMITGHGDVTMAVEAMRLGAYDFLEKPFDPEKLSALANKASAARRMVLESRALRQDLAQDNQLIRKLIGDSPSIVQLREDILDVGQADNHVLIEGETGTGKTLVAHALHAVGPRANRPFMSLSCAAWSEDQLLTRLFGPREDYAMPIIEEARGGTLCLEGVESLPQSVQTHLVDFLNQQGSPPETRVIAICTTRPQEDAPHISHFLRPDLLYRLRASVLKCSPLRTRGADIVQIFKHMITEYAEEYGCDPLDISTQEAAQLLQAPWPGNVRQIIHMAERAILQSRRGEQGLAKLFMNESLGHEGHGPHIESYPVEGQPRALKEHVEEFERLLIDTAMRKHKGNIGAVLAELALPRRTLNEKMTKYSLQRQNYL